MNRVVMKRNSEKKKKKKKNSWRSGISKRFYTEKPPKKEINKLKISNGNKTERNETKRNKREEKLF